ncbi:DUF2334 domain-containing protein [Geothrix campi]|uniref:DUF2334 domain-containing protein n=1 Tax=Geothrix campi TaxID=2966450 RepID=UPI00214850CE|nr:DUF2334 domain-containing protein [Geothrix sp. SG10]
MAESRYLIRFDDICPTMNWSMWEAIEAHLVQFQVKPILAVVPDNRDPKLMVDPPRQDFWDRVRQWQATGYTIALHGYQHLYVNKNAGMLGVTPQSEFAGLPRAEQEAKLRKALAIFAEQGVRVDAWVAPSHSFDRTTVGLLAELGVGVISDGLWPRPFTEANGITWLPQQLWSFHPKPEGVWTVCNHHNAWSAQRLDQFAKDLQIYASRITDVPAVLCDYEGRRISLSDRWSGFAEFLWTHRILGPIWATRRRLRELGKLAG